MGSASAGGVDSAAAGYRISVCLRRYYSDERARVALHVRAARPVRWLRRRLRALFAIPGRFALLSRGHLLPRDEPLALLDRDDLVEVVPTGGDVDLVDGAFRPASPEEAPQPTPPGETPRPAAPVDASWPVSPGDAPRPASPGAGAEPAELRDGKRRALEMLERYCGSAAETSDATAETPTILAEPSAPVAERSDDIVGVPRARRRRVRRRRRPPPSGVILEDGGAVCAHSEDGDRTSPIDVLVENYNSYGLRYAETDPFDRFCPVMHNEVKQTRAPRLVRPLDTAPSMSVH